MRCPLTSQRGRAYVGTHVRHARKEVLVLECQAVEHQRVGRLIQDIELSARAVPSPSTLGTTNRRKSLLVPPSAGSRSSTSPPPVSSPRSSRSASRSGRTPGTDPGRRCSSRASSFCSSGTRSQSDPAQSYLGVWLDRGELDRIIERTAARDTNGEPPVHDRRDDHDQTEHKLKKRLSFSADLISGGEE
jgi:Zn-finger nucleic acid-binding protein